MGGDDPGDDEPGDDVPSKAGQRGPCFLASFGNASFGRVFSKNHLGNQR